MYLLDKTQLYTLFLATSIKVRLMGWRQGFFNASSKLRKVRFGHCNPIIGNKTFKSKSCLASRPYFSIFCQKKKKKSCSWAISNSANCVMDVLKKPAQSKAEHSICAAPCNPVPFYQAGKKIRFGILTPLSLLRSAWIWSGLWANPNCTL